MPRTAKIITENKDNAIVVNWLLRFFLLTFEFLVSQRYHGTARRRGVLCLCSSVLHPRNLRRPRWIRHSSPNPQMLVFVRIGYSPPFVDGGVLPTLEESSCRQSEDNSLEWRIGLVQVPLPHNSKIFETTIHSETLGRQRGGEGSPAFIAGFSHCTSDPKIGERLVPILVHIVHSTFIIRRRIWGCLKVKFVMELKVVHFPLRQPAAAGPVTAVHIILCVSMSSIRAY